MDNSKAIESGIKKAIEIKNRILESSFIDLCESAILKAVESHTFQNRTGNLENSFTYGIFHDGVMIKSRSIGVGEGTDEAIKFLESYISTKDWNAVIVAGSWYGSLLENFTSTGWGKSWSSGGGRFIVLSDCFDFIVIEGNKFFRK